MRIATVLPAAPRDRVFRVTVKPVAGPLTARTDAVKVYVGYDVLVIQRPAAVAGKVEGRRQDKLLTLVNASNTAWEVFEGRQCDAQGRGCITLPATRLYAGAELRVPLTYDTPVAYRLTDGQTTSAAEF